jgi:ribonuclease Z
MQNFELTILGCSSATPTSTRNPTAQLLNVAERFFLIDCGEGTQIQLRKYKLKFQRINHIFISHLHGDHYLGLMGLLSSMHLLGRTVDLHLYSAPELKEIIEVQLKHSQTQLRYTIVYHPHRYIANDLIFEDNKVEVRTILLNHRIPCCGFLFTEKPILPNISIETLKKYRIPVDQIMNIKNGADYITADGTTVPNSELVSQQHQPRSYAFCSDTCYDERIIESIKGADLLYHEATFMDDMKERAKETYHSTTLQAATIAQKAGVKQLMIGHYSARYKDLRPLLDEAKSIFENTVLAVEGESLIPSPSPSEKGVKF